MGKTPLEIIELFCLTTLAVLTLLGNCLVILAFIYGPKTLRTYTNYFVVNLAVSDLMVGCLSLPFWIVFRADKHLVNDVYNYFIALDIMFGTVSIASLAAISLERLFAVKFTTRHFNLSKLPVMTAIVATWCCGIVFTGLSFVTGNDIKKLRDYTTSIFVLVFLLPLTVIIGSYFVIIYTAKNMVKTFREHGNMVHELHVAKTISVIISLFLLCWAPFFIINMVYVYCYGVCDEFPKQVIYLSKMMHYSNSMMNFFVYAVRSPDFRRTFKRILFKCDYTRVREKIRTFSESVATRSRAASERLSFIHDANHNQEPSNRMNGLKPPKRAGKVRFPQDSFCTDSSYYTDSNSSPSFETNNYLHQNDHTNCKVQQFVTSC